MQLLQGNPQGCAVLHQLFLGTRRWVRSLKLGANVHGKLQDCEAASGKVLLRPAANGKRLPLTLADESYDTTLVSCCVVHKAVVMSMSALHNLLRLEKVEL